MGRATSPFPQTLLYIAADGLVEVSFLKEILHIFCCSGFNFISWFFPVLVREGTLEICLGSEL